MPDVDTLMPSEMLSVALALLAAEQVRVAALERQLQALREELRRYTAAQVQAA